MQIAIDKLKENVQLSIRDTENLVKDLNEKLSINDPFCSTWFSYFSTKVKVDDQLRILQELNNALNH